MPIKFRLACALGLLSSAVWGQNNLDNPDWQELPVPPAPAFSLEGLLPVSMPAYVSLKVGVAPASVAVGEDGIVRYVVVMHNSSGTAQASYEGIRCVAGEVKIYARWSSTGGWRALEVPQWRALNDNAPSRHSQAIARQGACQARMAPSREEVLHALRQPDPSKR